MASCTRTIFLSGAKSIEMKRWSSRFHCVDDSPNKYEIVNRNSFAFVCEASFVENSMNRITLLHTMTDFTHLNLTEGISIFIIAFDWPLLFNIFFAVKKWCVYGCVSECSAHFLHIIHLILACATYSSFLHVVDTIDLTKKFR